MQAACMPMSMPVTSLLQVPGRYATSGASIELASAPQSTATLSAHQGEPVQGGALSSNVQKRRSLRRLRRQQVATAAAVAGAVAGVSVCPAQQSLPLVC